MTQYNGEPQPGGGLEQVYALVGDGLEITYSQVSIPDAGTTESLIYQGPDGKRAFTGNALRFQTNELGTLLTVTLQSIQEVTEEEIKLTLLLPGVHLAVVVGAGTVPIQTLAIKTISLDPTKGPSYQVYQLQGTVRWIFTEGSKGGDLNGLPEDNV
jgi:hypothetical protein